MIVRVAYVDGTTVEGDPSDWRTWPGQGVDWIEVQSEPGVTRVSGQSLYWLYPDGRAWVLGGGPIGYTNPLTEVVATEDAQPQRAIDYLPDLNLDQVKLGHWWPGKARPAHG